MHQSVIGEVTWLTLAAPPKIPLVIGKTIAVEFGADMNIAIIENLNSSYLCTLLQYLVSTYLKSLLILCSVLILLPIPARSRTYTVHTLAYFWPLLHTPAHLSIFSEPPPSTTTVLCGSSTSMYVLCYYVFCTTCEAKVMAWNNFCLWNGSSRDQGTLTRIGDATIGKMSSWQAQIDLQNCKSFAPIVMLIYWKKIPHFHWRKRGRWRLHIV